MATSNHNAESGSRSEHEHDNDRALGDSDAGAVGRGDGRTGCRSPKTRALIAYAEGALSDRARAHIERHLDRCDVCVDGLASIELYEDARPILSRAEVPVQYDRLAWALAREARVVARTIRESAPPKTQTLILAAAAAIALAFSVTSMSDPGAIQGPEARAEAIADRPVTLTAISSGTDLLRQGGWPQEGRAGTELRAGDAIRTAAGAQAHLGSSVSRLALESHTEWTVLASDAHGLTSRLTTGGVHSVVRPLTSMQRHTILAGEWRVEVRGTHYAVWYGRSTAEGLQVAVQEGAVEVYYGERSVAQVGAGEQFSSDGVAASDVWTPVSAGLRGAVQAVTLPAQTSETTWALSDAQISSQRSLSVLVPDSDEAITGVGRNGQNVRFALRGPAPRAIDTGEVQERAPVQRPGTLAPALIAPVVQRGARGLQKCQEKVAKNGPSVVGRFELTIRIGVTGEVEQVRLQPSVRPDSEEERRGHRALAECVKAETQRWHFPAPTGGPVTFSQPISYGTR